MRLALRASTLLPRALCLGALATFGCQSELLTLGTRPVETDGGSGGAGAGGTPVETSGGGDAGGTDGGQGGSEAAGAGASAAAAGSGGGTIRIIDVSPIAELSSDDEDDNPTLTADLLTIYFASTRGESADVWTATRSSPTGVFGTPSPVDAVNTDADETSPAVSLDGLTLWVGQNRDDGQGGNDIWVYTRSSLGAEDWSGPVNVTELNSSADDIPRPPGFGGLVMPLGSRRGLDGLYHTYLATRSSTSALFGAPVLLDELVFDERSTVDGFLTADGLTLFYASSVEQDRSDLYVVTRTSTNARFGAPVALTDVNSPADERDPWLSPDGKTLYFAADSDGDRDLFTAQVIWE